MKTFIPIVFILLGVGALLVARRLEQKKKKRRVPSIWFTAAGIDRSGRTASLKVILLSFAPVWACMIGLFMLIGGTAFLFVGE